MQTAKWIIPRRLGSGVCGDGPAIFRARGRKPRKYSLAGFRSIQPPTCSGSKFGATKRPRRRDHSPFARHFLRPLFTILFARSTVSWLAGNTFVCSFACYFFTLFSASSETPSLLGPPKAFILHCIALASVKALFLSSNTPVFVTVHVLLVHHHVAALVSHPSWMLYDCFSFRAVSS